MKAIAAIVLLLSASSSSDGGCAFIGKLGDKEIVLTDVGGSTPTGNYGSHEDKNYAWCINSPRPKYNLLCHSKMHGPETVYYEYSYRRPSAGEVYICKTGCEGAVVQEFVLVCNEGC